MAVGKTARPVASVGEPRSRRPAIGRMLVYTVALTVSTASAQPRSNAPEFAVGAGVGLVRFAPDDPETPGWFEIEGAAPALVFNRPGMSIAAVYATDEGFVDGVAADLDFVDVSLLVYGDVAPFGTFGPSDLEPFIPIALTTAYRRVRHTAGNRTLILFEYQTFGIGSGVGARAGGRRVRVEGHATPTIGFASRSFGGSTGLVYGLDSEAWLAFGPVSGRLGLSLGYGFSWQRWRVGGPESIAVAGSGRFDFTGREHVVRLGVSW